MKKLTKALQARGSLAKVTKTKLPGRFYSFLFLRCPNCRQGRLFNSWVHWIRMNERCPNCGLTFYPESGYFVGSIYVNYGATVAVIIASILVFHAVPERYQLLFFSCLAALTSLALFRHSRSFWITIDYWINPWQPPDLVERQNSADDLEED